MEDDGGSRSWRCLLSKRFWPLSTSRRFITRACVLHSSGRDVLRADTVKERQRGVRSVNAKSQVSALHLMALQGWQEMGS